MAKSLVTAFVFVLCAVGIFAEESESKWNYFTKKLDCGKQNPGSDQAKCHKYGTDSGFKCCWIQKEGGSNEDAMCKLLSYGEVTQLGLSGKEKQTKTFGTNEILYLACSSSYIKLISTSVIIALVSLIMF